MYQRKIPRRTECGVEITLQVIGGKWKPAILCHLRNGMKRPSELQRAIPDATRRVLNQQLKELEDHCIISKKIYPVLPPKVEYFLTDFGKCLDCVINAMDAWGNKYKKKVEAATNKVIELPQAETKKKAG